VKRGAAPFGLGLVVLVLLLPVGTGAPLHALPSATPSYLNYTNVSYRASTDGWQLSYDEWLPAHFNASATYPLVVFFHGIGNSTRPVPGGANIWASEVNGTTLDASTERALLQNASRVGDIFMVLNTRTSADFFANTRCGGPQLQDALDAIAHEKALRHIGALYLMGFSMGSMGVLEIAGHHLLPVAGVALAGPGTDLFEAYAWSNSTGGVATSTNPAYELVHDTCHTYPGTRSQVTSLLSWMSVARFDPQNFSNISMWVSAGGRDTGLPDNSAYWPYLQMNDTWESSTCRVASAYGEPANCTTTFFALHRAHPSEYDWRSVYEATAVHSIGQFDARDVFNWWAGLVSGGIYHAGFPPLGVAPGP
jgi:pimeloyl-ACP methyl ester carboxylesterase